MKRLTRPIDNFPCRLAGPCVAEDWMKNIYNEYPPLKGKSICDNCPFETIINRLAEYEDQEDDLK